MLTRLIRRGYGSFFRSLAQEFNLQKPIVLGPCDAYCERVRGLSRGNGFKAPSGTISGIFLQGIFRNPGADERRLRHPIPVEHRTIERAAYPFGA
ncbi:MAG: hypothetical protein AAGE76_16985 [Pseudomonadota bacterium]